MFTYLLSFNEVLERNFLEKFDIDIKGSSNWEFNMVWPHSCSLRPVEEFLEVVLEELSEVLVGLLCHFLNSGFGFLFWLKDNFNFWYHWSGDFLFNLLEMIWHLDHGCGFLNNLNHWWYLFFQLQCDSSWCVALITSASSLAPSTWWASSLTVAFGILGALVLAKDIECFILATVIFMNTSQNIVDSHWESLFLVHTITDEDAWW